MYATILFAYNNVEIKTRSSIINYIIRWKKKWSTPEGIEQIEQGINDLVGIKYIENAL